MSHDILRLLARQMTFILLGWYVSLGGEATFKLIMTVNWAAMNYIDPIPRLVISWYVGKTVGLLVKGRARG